MQEDIIQNEEWLDESIIEIKGSETLYKIICFLMGRRKKKLTYKELFVLIYGLNRKKYGEKKSKELAMLRILQIYKDLHDNKLPNGEEI